MRLCPAGLKIVGVRFSSGGRKKLFPFGVLYIASCSAVLMSYIKQIVFQVGMTLYSLQQTSCKAGFDLDFQGGRLACEGRGCIADKWV